MASGLGKQPLKRPREETAEEKEVDNTSLTPLEREILHTKQEQEGLLLFPVVNNDKKDASVLTLIKLKAIFCQQLPKMPKEYISRLVLDRQHVSLACTFKGEVVGGITYRPVFSQRMAEIVFCAVSATHQVQGYGTRIMNQIKEQCKRDNIEGMLTYADNHAVGYFRKQGFKKQVTMKRERWQGYLKDYEGATLMECVVDPTIDYLSTRQVAEQQRKAVVAKIAELEGAAGAANGKEDTPSRTPTGRDVLLTGWKLPNVECRYQGALMPVKQCLHALYDVISSHEDAWPFQSAVSVADAPDYYVIIKNPVDLSLIQKRLHQGGRPYYLTPEQLMAEIYLMCENCRLYNSDTTTYWECATRLEAFARNRIAADLVVARQPPERC